MSRQPVDPGKVRNRLSWSLVGLLLLLTPLRDVSAAGGWIVRDDGIGIDEALAHSGRAGHWGLAGMRERAQKVGGKFNIRTGPGKGTEIELTIAAQLAFPNRLKSMILGRLNWRGSRRS